jgi:hypothetical protein
MFPLNIFNLSNDEPIKQYDLNSVLSAQTDECVPKENSTSNEFYAYCENNYLSLPDDTAVVGVAPYLYNNPDDEEFHFITMEDFTYKNSADRIKVFGSFSENILNLHFSQGLNCLFASTSDNIIKQFDLSKGASELRLIKEYKFDPKFYITKFTICEGLLAVANQKGEVHFIDVIQREILNVSIVTAVKSIASLKLCKVMGNVYLCVCGGEYQYSSEKTDLYDVSGIRNLSIRKGDLIRKAKI